MSNWQNFDLKIDNTLLNDIANASANTGEFEELPLGRYEVKINSMQLTQSKNGDPMTKTIFEVVQGQYKGRYMFKNSVIYKGDRNDAWRLKQELNFINSLQPNSQVNFYSFSDFEKQISNAFADINSRKLEYLIEIKEKNNFRTYSVIEVYRPRGDDTPF